MSRPLREWKRVERLWLAEVLHRRKRLGWDVGPAGGPGDVSGVEATSPAGAAGPDVFPRLSLRVTQCPLHRHEEAEMPGIVGYGAFIPRNRIRSEEIARQWGKDPATIQRGLLLEEK